MGKSKYNFSQPIERPCIGAICRGEKNFISTDGSRLCKSCKEHNKRISDVEINYGNPNGSKPKK